MTAGPSLAPSSQTVADRDRSEQGAAGAPAPVSITMLGALPPWRGVAPYTRHLLDGLEGVEELEVEFLDFVSLYPPRLYPGGEPRDRNGRRPSFRRVRMRRLLAWYNPLSWLWAGLTLRGKVLHAQWWSHLLAPVYLVVMGLARLRGRRVVLTLHNVFPHETARWRRWLFQSVFRLAHRFIVHSERNAQVLIEQYPGAAGRVTVVPMGIHTVASGQNFSRQQARERLELPAESPVILAFGNIRPYKGLDVLLRALRRVVDAGQEATLLVAGQPWDSFERYQHLIDELDLAAHVRLRLEYLPESEVEACFAAADLAVFPYTHFDAQSAAATLALCAGVPLVVSDVGGLPELVDDARAVVPANDPEALAQTLRTVLDDEAMLGKLASDAKRRAAELDWGVIAQRTVEVYRAIG